MDLENTRAENAEKLSVIAARIAKCVACPLAKTRIKTVPGEGDPVAEIVFIGEAPGEAEGLTGRPFVGRAGQLLTKMILAMGLTREAVFVTNTVRCRPPNNRPPTDEEIKVCNPFLKEQLQIIKPKVICALGKSAAVGLGLVVSNKSLSSVRGRFHPWNDIPVMITYHPSYLLRTGDSGKRIAWTDLQQTFPYLSRRNLIASCSSSVIPVDKKEVIQ
jgi:DNA polymerase